MESPKESPLPLEHSLSGVFRMIRKQRSIERILTSTKVHFQGTTGNIGVEVQCLDSSSRICSARCEVGGNLWLPCRLVAFPVDIVPWNIAIVCESRDVFLSSSIMWSTGHVAPNEPSKQVDGPDLFAMLRFNSTLHTVARCAFSGQQTHLVSNASWHICIRSGSKSDSPVVHLLKVLCE